MKTFQMILAGLPPHKVISLAAKSFELWCYQMKLERNFFIAQIDILNKKVMETNSTYDTILTKLKSEFEAENEG